MLYAVQHSNEAITMGSSRRRRRRRSQPDEEPKMNRKLFDKAQNRVKNGPKVKVNP